MSLRTGVVVGVVVILGAIGSPASGQTQLTPSETLPGLPRSTHNSEVRVDRVPGISHVRVWINANEDDLRLYGPAGAQLDADIQVSTTFTPGSATFVVDMLVETRGSIAPGPGPQALVLVADGRAVAMTQRGLPAARSDDLLFLSVEARVPATSVMQLATAHQVDGRVWGVPFRFLDAQLELLRAFVWQVLEESPPR